MLLISSTFQKPLKQVKKNKLNEGSYNGDTIRNLEDKLDNFMVLIIMMAFKMSLDII